MDAAIAEIRSAPIAALGGASAFLSFLFMVFIHFRDRVRGIAPSATIGKADRLSIFTHCVLWPSSAISLAYIGSKVSPIFGLFLAFAAYGIGVYVLDVQSKKFVKIEMETGGVAAAAIVSALVFGVFWQALIEFVVILFTQHTDFAFISIFLLAGSLLVTLGGVAGYFYVAAPEFSRRHLGDH